MLLARTTRPWLTSLIAIALALPMASHAAPAPSGDDIVIQAREALRKRDKAALAAARIAINGAGHPLALWVEYWELSNRLADAQQSELDAFYARWPGSYVEDRLRNDWMLELGKRRDWVNLRAEYPRFRMNDDREVSCYALVAQHLDGQDVRNAARTAWLAAREPEDGCVLLGRTLFEARVFTAEDVWPAARAAVEANRPRVARAVVALLGEGVAQAASEALDKPERYLARRPALASGTAGELSLLALMRLAASDPDAAAAQLQGPWSHRLPLALSATAWAHAGKQAALKQMASAPDDARQAWQQWDAANKPGTQPLWSNELLAWQVRAALRLPEGDKQRWTLVARAIDAMNPAEPRDAAWTYWRARAWQAGAAAAAGPEGDAMRALARQTLESIAPQLSFYGKLATEDLGGRLALPPAPAQLTAAEREAARSHPGLARGLQLIAIGLRHEGVREWNFSLRGMRDRELLAAAQWACEREVWDRCISTSERTRGEIDLNQRFPMPYREQVLATAQGAGLDPALVYGLIRQESRFVADTRSGAGAMGLMQLMPATARWTAKQIGLAYQPTMIAERETNLQLGAAYLKRVIDDFGGSLAMATAAYNAGPGRPRRWREGGVAMEPAAWAESIPFNETRDYVKKVLSNSVVYAALLGANPARTTLKARLGPPIGGTATTAAAPSASTLLGLGESNASAGRGAALSPTP